MMDMISRNIDKLNRVIGNSIAWLTVLMVLVTFLIVVMRYAFNEGSIALQESVVYMHALVFMLAAAITMQKDEHVRVDIFYRDMSIRKKAIVNVLGTLLLLLPVCGFIAWSSWDYVLQSWQLKESSREAGGLEWLYVLKTSIILMAVLLILQAISELIKNTRLIFNPNTPTSDKNN